MIEKVSILVLVTLACILSVSEGYKYPDIDPGFVLSGSETDIGYDHENPGLSDFNVDLAINFIEDLDIPDCSLRELLDKEYSKITELKKTDETELRHIWKAGIKNLKHYLDVLGKKISIQDYLNYDIGLKSNFFYPDHLMMPFHKSGGKSSRRFFPLLPKTPLRSCTVLDVLRYVLAEKNPLKPKEAGGRIKLLYNSGNHGSNVRIHKNKGFFDDTMDNIPPRFQVRIPAFTSFPQEKFNEATPKTLLTVPPPIQILPAPHFSHSHLENSENNLDFEQSEDDDNKNKFKNNFNRQLDFSYMEFGPRNEDFK